MNYRRFAKLSLTFSSIVFVGYTVFRNYEKLREQSIEKESFSLLIISLILSFISIIVNALAWTSLITWLGYSKSNIRIVHLFLRTNLLKYLPGGIWHFLERFRFLSILISPAPAFSSVLLEPFLMVSAALFLVPFSSLQSITSFLFFIPSIFLARRWRGALLMQLGAMKLLQFKELGEKLSFTKKSPKIINPSSPYPFKPFLIEIFFLLFRFGSFWFCLKSFSTNNYLNIIDWLSLFSLSWAAGLVVPSAPGGIGVFESSVLLLARDIPQESIILVLICYRFIVTFSDIILAFLLVFWKWLPVKLIEE